MGLGGVYVVLELLDVSLFILVGLSHFLPKPQTLG